MDSLFSPMAFSKNRDRHLAAAVNAEIEQILGVKLEIKPRTTVRDDARGEQQLAGAVGFALVMFKEDARRTVQLGHDHAFRTVDDEGTLVPVIKGTSPM